MVFKIITIVFLFLMLIGMCLFMYSIRNAPLEDLEDEDF